MNTSRNVLQEGQDKSKAVACLGRDATGQESYVNGRLEGLHSIIESHGGIVLLKDPGPEVMVDMGREIESSVCYWNGITLRSRYVPKNEAYPINGAFDSQVYTSRKDWKEDPAMKEVLDFYIASPERVNELVRENRAGFSFK
ncbi:MAG TPA: hypothetical protein VJK03_04035 [Candidatus Nanoarchaeia archaeon]|nr:hypothetical protein [Candidatus Nanoarchaeia archaeon]